MFRSKPIYEDVVIPPLRTPILGKENVGSNMFVRKICTTIKGERLTRGAFYVFSAIGTPVLLLQLYNTVILPRSGHSSQASYINSSRYGTIFQHAPSAARIKQRTCRAKQRLRRGFGLVKTAVIYGELASSRLGIDIDEAFAEANIPPAVIVLCLDGSSNNRINP